MALKSHYDILGIPQDADTKQIRKAYLKKSLAHHPDKNPSDPEGAKLIFVKIGRAYEVLSDPKEKLAYDRELRRHHSTAPEGRDDPVAGGSYDYNGRTSFKPSGGGTPAGPAYGYDQYHPSGHGVEDYSDASGFDRYKDVFDNFMSGMSEEEIRAATGAAALVGSIIGSVVAGRMASRGGSRGGGGGLLAGAVSLLGSQAGAAAASSLVESVHQSSVETKEYRRRREEALRRGELPPDKPKGGLETLFRRVTDEFGSYSAAESSGRANHDTSGNRSSMGDGSGESGGGFNFMQAAMNMAGSLAEGMQNQNRQRRQ